MVDPTSLAHMEFEEQGRRNRAEDELANLQGDAYDAARAKEMDLRAAFDEGIQGLKDRQCSSAQMDHSALPATSFLSSPSSIVQPVTSVNKKRWFRFRCSDPGPAKGTASSKSSAADLSFLVMLGSGDPQLFLFSVCVRERFMV